MMDKTLFFLRFEYSFDQILFGLVEIELENSLK